MTDNRTAWTRYYESTISPRRRAREQHVVRSEKQAPKVLRGAEKQIAEDNAQFRRYNRAKAAAYQTALKGPYGDLIRDLHDTLKHIEIDKGDSNLIALVETIEWASVDLDTSYVALSMIDDAIVRLREQAGLPPFDDAIFDEDLTVFQLCKAKLRVP